jgi:hypothetical protein
MNGPNFCVEFVKDCRYNETWKMSAEILIKINSKGSVVTTTVKSPRYYKPKSSDLNAVSLPDITSPRVQTSMLLVSQLLQAQEFRPQCW